MVEFSIRALDFFEKIARADPQGAAGEDGPLFSLVASNDDKLNQRRVHVLCEAFNVTISGFIFFGEDDLQIPFCITFTNTGHVHRIEDHNHFSVFVAAIFCQNVQQAITGHIKMILSFEFCKFRPVADDVISVDDHDVFAHLFSLMPTGECLIHQDARGHTCI